MGRTNNIALVVCEPGVVGGSSPLGSPLGLSSLRGSVLGLVMGSGRSACSGLTVSLSISDTAVGETFHGLGIGNYVVQGNSGGVNC